MTDLTRTVDAALSFLEAAQEPSGAFAVRNLLQPLTAAGVGERSLFATAVVAEALDSCTDPRAVAVRQRGARHLREQMDPGGVWRYWTRDHPHHQAYPPDADDTAAAALVLESCGLAVPDNHPVLLANRDPRGRFYTWLVVRRLRELRNPVMRRVAGERVRARQAAKSFWVGQAPEPDDVDGVVNLQVLAYLGDGTHAAAVTRYAREILEAGAEARCDKWYRSAYIVYSGIARCLAAGITEMEALVPVALERIAAGVNADGSIGQGALDTAWALRTLGELGADTQTAAAAAASLAARQEADGSWPAESMFFGGTAPHAPSWGSAALTTAICLGAITRAVRIQSRPPDRDRPAGRSRAA